jgi:hypothetical protein
MTVGEIRRMLKWVIKYIEMFRDGVCSGKKARFAIAMSDSPVYGIDCPPPPAGAPPGDICKLLDEVIKGLKKILDEFGGIAPTETIKR